MPTTKTPAKTITATPADAERTTVAQLVEGDYVSFATTKARTLELVRVVGTDKVSTSQGRRAASGYLVYLDDGTGGEAPMGASTACWRITAAEAVKALKAGGPAMKAKAPAKTAGKPAPTTMAKAPAEATARKMAAVPARETLAYEALPVEPGAARTYTVLADGKAIGTVSRDVMPATRTGAVRQAWTFTSTDGRQGGPALYKGDAVLAAYAPAGG